LEDVAEILGNKPIAVAREITKKFEEIKRGYPKELLDFFSQNRPRGEFVLILNLGNNSLHQ